MNEIGKKDIEHLGRVIAMDDEKITVSIVSAAACSSCSSKSNCSVGDVEEKIVEVSSNQGRNVKINEVVTVILDSKYGAWAVLLGYVFPFLAMLITLIIMQSLGFGQGQSGLAALAMLLPYYGILYITKKSQARTFSFRLK